MDGPALYRKVHVLRSHPANAAWIGGGGVKQRDSLAGSHLDHEGGGGVCPDGGAGVVLTERS